MGDVKLVAALGLFFGASNILAISIISFLLGAIISIILVLSKKRKIDDYIPFGPFIVIASFPETNLPNNVSIPNITVPTTIPSNISIAKLMNEKVKWLREKLSVSTKLFILYICLYSLYLAYVT